MSFLDEILNTILEAKHVAKEASKIAKETTKRKNSFNVVSVGSGKSIQIINNKVYVNGKLIDTGNELSIQINVEGDCGSIQADCCDSIQVQGNVNGDVKSTSGDIVCKNITGNVSSTSGDVSAEIIHGSVHTVSGDIN